jgi:hypothetical protein
VTPKEFRAAVNNEINAWATSNFPTIPVIYENGPVPDEDAIGPIWLDVEVRWYGAHNATLGVMPRVRHSGAVSVSCLHRGGEGTDQPDTLIDSISTYLQNRRLSAGVTEAAQRTVPTSLRGWYKTGTLIPFLLG